MQRPCWLASDRNSWRLTLGLGRFLYERVYRHHRVIRMAAKGRRILLTTLSEVHDPTGIVAGTLLCPLEAERRFQSTAGPLRAHPA